MNNKLHITDETILDYIDGVLSQKEKSELEEVASKNIEVAERISEMKQLDSWLILREEGLKEPSRDFNQMIMANLDRPMLAEGLVKFRKGGLYMLLVSLLTIAIGSFFITDNTVTLNVVDKLKLMSLSGASLPEEFNLKILSQTLLFGGLITSLLLLDKAVLKPFFRNRRSEIQY